MKTPHYARVEKFMQMAEQATPDKPVVPDEETRRLRAKLILEEALETIEALGFFAILHDPKNNGEPAFIPHDAGPDLVLIADGCADISVVTIGTLIACGIPDGPLLEMVDLSNLAKFTGDAHRRADGKWIKPSDWKPPAIETLISKLDAGDTSVLTDDCGGCW